ncbi:protein-L-isoaspartate(D-aspartate) O-methyltransferase [Chelatococcus sambhunathii]|uniref:Protein-L-isoaspartate O-methyltransferase n=1 Tax=Chelatococcus sambhunathii TaxID=363953 RepID=A0ABU1DHP0_9HYPH|nr:protein-L-isoaspartate(D-aspartate) O-methyltransferase [Chelatococcus sambhunathii]MDR4307540.1 protein-L-isoaspartate(D-aspartate) O-methyltransferase [Chelatococcus sambhunathii]
MTSRAEQADPFLAARRAMAELVRARGVRDPLVLDAMGRVPRERFVSPSLAGRAYDDGPLPIGGGQTISQPYVVALMAEAARLTPASRVLEVGGGCGYAAAVYAAIASEVVSIEQDAALAAGAAGRLAALGFANVTVAHGDGAAGWPEKAPFDAILVAAAAIEPPPALLDQLADGGRLVIPVGPEWGRQELLRVKRENGSFRKEPLGGVRFVPLL